MTAVDSASASDPARPLRPSRAPAEERELIAGQCSTRAEGSIRGFTSLTRSFPGLEDSPPPALYDLLVPRLYRETMPRRRLQRGDREPSDRLERAMSTRVKVLSTLVGALLAVAAPVVMAQPRGPSNPADPSDRRDFGGWRSRERSLFEFLDLTPEQREAWIATHRAHFEALRPTIEKIRDLRGQLHDELEGGSPDAATVGGWVIAIHDLDSDLDAAREELEASIREILTDEQETKLEAWQEANPGRRRGPGGPGWGGPHHGGPPPGDDDPSAD
jgi:Spy/CpxP family protein refolding chaperone